MDWDGGLTYDAFITRRAAAIASRLKEVLIEVGCADLPDLE